MRRVRLCGVWKLPPPRVSIASTGIFVSRARRQERAVVGSAVAQPDLQAPAQRVERSVAVVARVAAVEALAARQAVKAARISSLYLPVAAVEAAHSWFPAST